MSRFLVFVLIALQGCSATQSPPNPEVYAGGSIKKEDIKKFQSDDYKTEDTSNEDARHSLELQMAECEKNGFYYDLGAFLCDEGRKLMNIDCTLSHILDPETKGFLADNQKKEVDDLFKGELQGYDLRFCVDDLKHYTIVAIRTATDGGIKYDVVELEVTR
jgi:hypothetical protein